MDTYNFDHIVSLGYNCEIANSILALSMRDAAYPFDWNFSKMWKINETMRLRFSNFFLKENLTIARYTKNPAMEKDEGFTYVHNGAYDSLQNIIEYEKEKEKYDRRILRLIELLDNGKPVLFVRLVYEDKIEEHLEFIKTIEEVYPNSLFRMVVICQGTNNIYIEHNKIDYVSGIKINRYCIGEYLRENYKLPIYECVKKEY
jgi:hypothetical protein